MAEQPIQHAESAVPTYADLLAFVRSTAALRKDGEEVAEGDDFIFENDEALETVESLIGEARRLLGSDEFKPYRPRGAALDRLIAETNTTERLLDITNPRHVRVLSATLSFFASNVEDWHADVEGEEADPFGAPGLLDAEDPGDLATLTRSWAEDLLLVLAEIDRDEDGSPPPYLGHGQAGPSEQMAMPDSAESVVLSREAVEKMLSLIDNDHISWHAACLNIKTVLWEALNDRDDEHEVIARRAWDDYERGYQDGLVAGRRDGSTHQEGCRAEDGFPCHCLAQPDGDDEYGVTLGPDDQVLICGEEIEGGDHVEG
jgi:hypothetical protein